MEESKKLSMTKITKYSEGILIYWHGSGTSHQTKKYEYDSLGRLYKEYFRGLKDINKSNVRKEIQYIYDKKGNLASKAIYHRQSNIAEVEVYKYNDKNLVSEITFIRNLETIDKYRIEYYFYD